MGRSTNPAVWKNWWVNPINCWYTAYQDHLSPSCLYKWSFRGSQLNWAALTKEAYAIYMCQLENSASTLLMLMYSSGLTTYHWRNSLNKNTMNAKVNNWAVELETYNLKFEYIQGIKNTLADTLSRLIEIDPDVELPMEQPGQNSDTTSLRIYPLSKLEKSLLRELRSNLIQIPFWRKLT